MRIIYVWPDYGWCDTSDYPQEEWRGDDFMLVQLPDDVDDVDKWLYEHRVQDFPAKKEG